MISGARGSRHAVVQAGRGAKRGCDPFEIGETQTRACHRVTPYMYCTACGMACDSRQSPEVTLLDLIMTFYLSCDDQNADDREIDVNSVASSARGDSCMHPSSLSARVTLR